MPFDILDDTTWATSILFTPGGPIRYWVLADLDGYYEQYATDNTLTKVQIAVDWYYALVFKWYALGFAEGVFDFELVAPGVAPPPTGQAYLNRFTPLPNPLNYKQYLTDLKKVKILPGVQGAVTGFSASVGTPLPAVNNPVVNNWPDFPRPVNTTGKSGMPPRIVYDATFSMLAYDVVPQAQFVTTDRREGRRFVVRTEKGSPRERKQPSAGYARDDTGTVIPEVGFIPYYDEAHVVTWVGVPWELVPRTAMRQSYLTINNAAFEFKSTGQWGRFPEGTVRFDGLAREITPYRNAAGQRVVDLPYLFTHQPGDPTAVGGDTNTHWKIPMGTSWVLIHRRGAAGPPYADADRLYLKSNFEKLFQPEFI